MRSVTVAYSGGVDSTLLLKVCKDILQDKVLAVIAKSETYPKREIRDAIAMAKKLKAPFLLIETKELENKNFVANSQDRCYWCKRELFSRIRQIARKNKTAFVADGSNYDDLSDFRPGSRAAEELDIRKPLLEAQLRKREIRQISKKKGLPNWDKPSFACLASRLPYGTRIDKRRLRKIDKAEQYIMDMGIKQVRVRDYQETARIEVSEEEFPLLTKNRDRIVKYLRRLGYLFISLDLEGYRTGSLNKHLRAKAYREPARV